MCDLCYNSHGCCCRAPSEHLRCSCKTDCSTRTFSSKKPKTKCSAICSHCEGNSCKNPPEGDSKDDDVEASCEAVINEDSFA